MNACFFTGRSLRCNFSLWLLLLAGWSLQGQSIFYEQNNDNSYTFGVTQVGELKSDLVFYRFSDGFHQIGRRSLDKPTAPVTRWFPAGTPLPTVSAIVAKKNGSLGYAGSATINQPVSCGGCPPPYVGLGDAEYIRLGYSWLGYTNAPTALTDNSTAPDMTTPAQPWLILVVTVKPLLSASFAEITLPAAYTYDGTIYKDTWGQSISQGNIDNVTYNQGANKVTIELNGSETNESNIYLLVKGTPVLNQTYTFNASLKDTKKVYGTSILPVETRLDPHDPNMLTSDHEYFCPRQVDVDPVKYRVEFQNIGEAPAENVVVTMQFSDFNVLDNMSLELVGSDPLPIQDVIIQPFGLNNASTQVKFFLYDIFLPGLYQFPKQPLDKTIGWLEFELTPKDCLPIETAPLVSHAVITFMGPGFEEDIATDFLKQVIGNVSCPAPDDRCDSMFINAAGRENSFGAAPQTGGWCYPSPFSDVLHIEMPPAGENTSYTALVTDLTGKQWLTLSRDVSAGQYFREDLETANLPGGMYIVYINRGGGETTVHKVFKNN